MALVVKNPPANAIDVRDMGLISGLDRSPREGHGNPLQYSCLENPMGGGAWWAIVTWGRKEYHDRDIDLDIIHRAIRVNFIITLCYPMGHNLLGSSGHGILQARILEWVAISYSRRSCRPRDCVSCISRQILYS